MVRHLCCSGLLLLLVVAAGEASQNRAQTTRQGGSKKPAVNSRVAEELRRRPGLLHIEPNKRNIEIKLPFINPKPVTNGIPGKPELVTVLALKMAKFDFGGNETLEKELQDNGHYNPKSAVMYDATVDTEARNRVFMTTPQIARGIPYSLSTLPFHGPNNSLLKPYPSRDLHRTTEDTITNCTSQLVSVFTTTKSSLDPDTLFVLDSGVLDIVGTPNMMCPPKIVSFDLRTDKIISTTVIDNTACNSIYTFIRVEPCSAGGLVAYISDTVAFQLVVVDLTTGETKRLQSQYDYPVPRYFFTKAGGPSTYLPYGLYGIAGDDNCDGKLYLQAHATNIQSVVDKKVIRNASDGDILDDTAQAALPGHLSGPAGPLAADHTGQLLFFPSQDDLAVYCWNTSKPHDPKNFRLIAQDDKALQYFGSMKVDRISQRLYLVTNRFTKYLSKTIEYSDYNYRLLFININGLVC